MMTFLLRLYLLSYIIRYCIGCPVKYAQCALENSTCNHSGIIAYGIDNNPWAYKQNNNSIGCNNAIFGDPAYRQVKECCCLVNKLRI